MTQFFRTGLIMRYGDEQLAEGILVSKYTDPQRGFRMNDLGFEIIETAARNQGMSVAEFIRKSLFQTVESIYTVTELD